MLVVMTGLQVGIVRVSWKVRISLVLIVVLSRFGCVVFTVCMRVVVVTPVVCRTAWILVCDPSSCTLRSMRLSVMNLRGGCVFIWMWVWMWPI